MKKYVLRNKLLLSATLITGGVFAIGSTLIAFILQEIIDVAIAKDMEEFFAIIMKTIIYIAFLGLCHIVYSILSKKFIGKVICALRGEVFNGIFRKNMQDFKTVNSADYLSALTNDMKLVEENYLVPLLFSLENILVFIVSFVVMLYLSPIAMLTLIITMLLLVVVPGIFKEVLQKRQDAYSKKLSHLTIAIKDFLSGFEVIRSYRMHNYTTEAFDKENKDTYNSRYFMDRIVAYVESISIILGLVVQCSVLFVSAYLIVTGKITAGVLVALVQVSGTIVGPIQVLSQNVPKIQGTKPIINRLFQLVNSEDITFTGRETPTFEKQIEVRNLRFGYEIQHEVVKGIDFVFESGKKYAIIGKSGCGKSTFINLLTGCYSGYEGEILYDGSNMRQLDIEKLNEMTAIIHQNVYMFDETIMDNIALHKSVSKEDLEYALQMSGVNMFLDDYKSLDTPVGENGSNLSGGQRQRVAVARALVQKKPILVLDEGTSAIDMKTAYDIESSLLQQEELTVLTITHALNPELLRAYDIILFMEEGAVIESGTYDELTAVESKFLKYCSLEKSKIQENEQ